MDASLRALEREIAEGAGNDARLRYARLLLRHGRTVEALPSLYAASDDPEARRELALYATWGELERATRFIDASPLREKPVVAWTTKLPPDFYEGRLTASGLAVIHDHEYHPSASHSLGRPDRGWAHLLDPVSGEPRARLRGSVRALDEDLILDTSVIQGLRRMDRPPTSRKAPPRGRPLLVSATATGIVAEDPDRVGFVWEVPRAGGPLAVSPEVVVARSDPVRTAYDRRTGRKLWTLKGEVDACLADANGLVSRVKETRELEAHDLRGRRLWKVDAHGLPYALLPDVILAVDREGDDFVVLDRATGSRIRSFAIPASKPTPGPWAIVVARDVIYVGARSSLVALTLEGEHLWCLDRSNRALYALAATEGRIYGLTDGLAFCIAPEGTPSSRPPRARKRKRKPPSRTPPGEPRRESDALYFPAATFRKGQAIFHAKFGRGSVVGATTTSIEVVFTRRSGRGEERRVLAHSRADLPRSPGR